MNQVLIDNRKFKAVDADEADALFAEIAGIELQAAAIGADGDAEVQRLKDKYEKLLTDAKLGLEEKVEFLTQYIQANTDRFQKPRARKTPEGTYGLRTVSNLEIEDPKALLIYAKENNLTDLYEINVTLNKKAIQKAISEGMTIPGARIADGERAFYKINQELLSKAKGK